ncbi:MAG TPA: M28 family peptidase, partial [Acidobacteriota bacterium]|nr:M28 family peptidase [Acidobacteriota bacterium]
KLSEGQRRSMGPGQARLVYGLMVLVVLCWLVSPTTGNVQEPAWVLPQYPFSFDASRAYEMTRDFVTRFPRRVIGSFEARGSTGFIKQHLEPLGYKIDYMNFDATISGLRHPVGRNVLAFRPGQNPEIIAVLAHYDTARTTRQGAMDDGSGIGVLLELAKVFSAAPTRRSLLLVATDGEEWGMLGARELARSYPERSRIVAALSLDFVAIGKLNEITLDTVGQMGGYTPPWLREIARLSIQAQSLPVSEAYGLREHVERSLLISETDQGPLLNVGIAAINLGSESVDRARQDAIYHSMQDTIDNLEVASVNEYGRIAEEIVRTLDGLRTIPVEPMGSYHLKDLIFLSARSMSILHYLTFLPLPAVLLFYLLNHKRYLRVQRVLRELFAFAGTLIPFLSIYYCIVLLKLLRVTPAYSLYPATLKDPVLEHPSKLELTVLASAAVVVAVACFFILRLISRKMARPDFHISKLILLAILSGVVLIALLHNGYWAVTFLALPVWIWMLISFSPGAGGRAANRLCIMAAGVPCYVIEWLYATRLGLGWKLAWYEILALSTGLFTFSGFLLASAAISLGVRFFVIQSQSRADSV